jgi:filamentous hemagglutinin family protein
MRTDTLTGRRSRYSRPCSANSRSKHSTSIMQRAGSASAAVLLAVLGTAHALPQNGQVVAGTGAIAQAGATMTVTQTSPKLAINWQGFDIAAGQSVNFGQPGASSIVLNRVLGQNPTSILGNLTANGQVFVVNPSGIVFAVGSQVNVGGLVASSHSLSDADFLAGIYRFSGAGVSGTVRNQGRIAAADGGYVVFIGPVVSNGRTAADGGSAQNLGSIIAPHGTALLASAEQVTLQLNGSSLLGYTVDRAAVNAFAENAQFGTITANGGKVVLTARAVNALAPAVVNNDGIIEARTIVEPGGGQSSGVIQLLGDMSAGQVNQNGRLDATAPNGGNGGSIEISAAKVTVADTAQVKSTSLAGQASGGKVLVAANDFRIERIVRGGDMSPAQLKDALENNASVTIAAIKAGGTGGGDILVSQDVNWSANSTLNLIAERSININGTIQNADNGNLVLRADSTGTGIGAVFIPASVAPLMAKGHTDLYYNPASISNLNDYAPFFAGSVTSYWLVNNLAQLQAINANLSGNYALGRDIDASASSSNSTPFTPIGSVNGAAFTGKFDGLNHVISSLRVLSSDFSVGLFGFIDQATISNVGLAGGSTTAARSWAGGLAGFSTRSTIRNVFNTGTVDGNAGAGGLVGIASRTTIQDAYASGSVASAFGPAGGLAASIDGGAISGSYSSGTVSGPGSSGLVGQFDAAAATTTQNNYWYSSTPIADSNRAGVTKLDTVAQLNSPNSFGGFDLNTTWRQYDGFGSPLLKSFLKPLTITLSDSTKTYDGVAGAPVQFTFSDPAATASGTGLVFQPPPQNLHNAGIYTFSPNAWSNQVNGFDIRYAGGKTSATTKVIRAPLTIVAIGATRTYDGTTSSTAKPNVTGLQPGDTVDVIQSYDSRNAGARTLTPALALISDGNGGNNYAIQYLSAGGTLLQAPLAIAAVSDTKAFDGTITSGKTPLVTGLVPGDSLSGNVETFDAAGIGARILTAASVVNDGNGGANYAISKSTAAGQILGGRAVLDGLLSGSPKSNAVALAAAFLADPGSPQAAARNNALDGAGATNPTNVLAQSNDDLLLYAPDSMLSGRSSAQERQGRHTFNVEGSGIRLPEGVD